jgi:hypothetical protein
MGGGGVESEFSERFWIKLSLCQAKKKKVGVFDEK